MYYDSMTTRSKLGILTVLLLGIALSLRLFADKDNATAEFACLRMAIVLGAAWMAYPQLMTLPRWMMLATAAVGIVAAIKPKALIIGLPLLVALFMLRPKSKPPLRR
jgi:hypothetical protein